MKSDVLSFSSDSFSNEGSELDSLSEIILKGPLFYFIDEPLRGEESSCYVYIESGLLYFREGKIIFCGDEQKFSPPVNIHQIKVKTYSQDKLIVSGFIDTHIHYPQVDMMASFGDQLLDWLNHYTFPEEIKFRDKNHCKEVAQFFVQQLFCHGTTTACVYGTSHRESVESLFDIAEKYRMRVIAGNILMDRNAPADLLQSVQSSYDDSLYLIHKWHEKLNTRISYAVTPRFAPSCSPELLEMAGGLFHDHNNLYMQTHLAENKMEVDWVKKLFPERANYLDVYDYFHLTGRRSIFAHGIHLCEGELEKIKNTCSALSFCPSSNLFLGSGLFPYARVKEKNIFVGLGSDIGAGTSFSSLQNLSDAYKILQLQEQKLSALEAFYLASLGGARSLNLGEKIGSLEAGKEADCVVLDLASTDLIRRRMKNAEGLEEQLFILMMLGDDRSVFETFVNGESVYIRRN